MLRRGVGPLAGLFALLQLALASAGVWADVQHELQIFQADVHVEAPSESCIDPHDHRLCVLGRSLDGVTAKTVVTDASTSPMLRGAPVVDSESVAQGPSLGLPPNRGPPAVT